VQGALVEVANGCCLWEAFCWKEQVHLLTWDGKGKQGEAKARSLTRKSSMSALSRGRRGARPPASECPPPRAGTQWRARCFPVPTPSSLPLCPLPLPLPASPPLPPLLPPPFLPPSFSSVSCPPRRTSAAPATTPLTTPSTYPFTTCLARSSHRRFRVSGSWALLASSLASPRSSWHRATAPAAHHASTQHLAHGTWHTA